MAHCGMNRQGKHWLKYQLNRFYWGADSKSDGSREPPVSLSNLPQLIYKVIFLIQSS